MATYSSHRLIMGKVEIDSFCCLMEIFELFLAHLSRRLIGELIVYSGIRRPFIVRPSTFSNDISSEAVRPILSILHTKHLQVGGTKSYVFYSGRIRTLVAMATYSSHRLIMGKV